MLELAYELLRATPPFRGWHLPPGEEVEFHVTRSKRVCGDHMLHKGQHRIRISSVEHKMLPELLWTMAHEMCHMRHTRRYPRDRAHHGARFQSYAQAVCRHHNIALESF